LARIKKPTMARAHPIMDNNIRAAMCPFYREFGSRMQHMDLLGVWLGSAVVLEG
jgi:hypothetical protein